MTGEYALSATPELAIDAPSRLVAGRVRIAKGRRSPELGMRTSALHEVGHVLSGRLRIETADRSYEVAAGDSLVMCPAERHSTTALEDSEIFFVLLDPQRASQ
ncbi:MAG: hypothetical protein C4K60_11255 [Ideonella sp. MAG2]|nr:MAG: hypothetical protein C4K60_11255 [Ideonella sp. MAG2]